MKLYKAMLIASPFELVTNIVWLGNKFLFLDDGTALENSSQCRSNIFS